MKKRWRPPFYDTQMEEGLPHERTFGIMCIVNNYSEIGFGKSKRLAKRQAAYNMIQLIERLQQAATEGDGEFFPDVHLQNICSPPLTGRKTLIII